MKSLNPSFLLDLEGPILVTGHTGFKGTWLVHLLRHLGIRAYGIALPPKTDSIFTMTDSSKYVSHTELDIRDSVAVQNVIANIKPRIIIHMAAQPLVLESYKTPGETFEVNVQGTVNVLEAARKVSSVEAVCVITTDKVYKNDNNGKLFIETDPLEGKDPYSASKVGTESVVTAWQQLREHLGGPVVFSVRAGNVIGGGDTAENRLLPDLINALRDGKELIVRNPNSTRPWQHVLDPLIGYLHATSYNLKNQTQENFNFGPAGDSLTVRTVAEIASNCWGKDVALVVTPGETGLESEFLGLDSSKAHKLLNWHERLSQEEAIRSTVNWWMSVSQGKLSALESCEIDISKSLENLL